MPAGSLLLDGDAAAFRSAFGREPFVLSHGLSNHPDLTRDAVVALAGRVPRTWLSAVAGDLPLVVPNGLPGLGFTAVDAARTIDDVRGRVVFHYLERIERYRCLLADAVDHVVAAIGTLEGAGGHQEAHIFLIGPDAVAPVHFDRHHKVLFQIEGTKDLAFGSFIDPRVERSEIERAFTVGHNYCRAVPTPVETYHLEPGDALYVPPYRFHWVEPGAAVAVTFSAGFSTAHSERAELVHACNARLRRLGLPARPPGRSARRDRVKAAAFSRARQLREVSRRGRRGRAGPASAR
jgi:hypothetical protein